MYVIWLKLKNSEYLYDLLNTEYNNNLEIITYH